MCYGMCFYEREDGSCPFFCSPKPDDAACQEQEEEEEDDEE